MIQAPKRYNNVMLTTLKHTISTCTLNKQQNLQRTKTCYHVIISSDFSTTD